MGALIGLGFGIGLLLIWSAFVLPLQQLTATRRDGYLARLLSRSGLSDVTPVQLALLCLVLAVVTFVLVQAVTGAVPVAVSFAVMAGWSPIVILKGRVRKRQAEFAEVWPEAVDNLTSAVRAGLSLPEAVAGLAAHGPEPLREAFAHFALDYQASGRFSESLDRLKERLADPVGDRVIEGLRIAREVGGGELGRLLRNLSGYLRDEQRTRSELESRQSWTINGARLAVAAPWAILGFMAFQPDLMKAYATLAGALVLAFGGAACVLAYRLMLRFARLPVEDRILR